MKTQFKTIADFKRAIKPGTILGTIHHQATKRDEAGNVMRDENGQIIYTEQTLEPAPVSIVQSTQFAVKRTYKDKTQDSWCGFPKASKCIIKENSVTILEEDGRKPDRPLIPILTYTVLETPATC